MGSAVPMPPSPDELRARAAAIREELKELEANASVNRRPNAELAEPKRVRVKTTQQEVVSRCNRYIQPQRADLTADERRNDIARGFMIPNIGW